MDGQVLAGALAKMIGRTCSVHVYMRGCPAPVVVVFPDYPLTEVTARPDGLIETAHSKGWAVFDPAAVAAVSGIEDPTEGEGKGGHYL